MKRLGMLCLVILSAILFCIGCGLVKKPVGGNEPASGNGGVMEFQKLRISENSMMAYSTVYSAEKTENGVHLEYYLGGFFGDDGAEEKQMIRQFDGDESVYRQLAEMAEKYQLSSWDGFHGSDPNVLDGYGFTLEVVLADGTGISASGSNKFPDGYHGFVSEIDALLSRAEITDTQFDAGDYTIELPESWLHTVTAVFREGYVAFEVQTEDQNRTIFCIYNEPYEYGDGAGDYQTIKQYQKDGSDWYIVMYRYPESYSAYEEMNEEQKAICDALDADMQKIAESLTLK